MELTPENPTCKCGYSLTWNPGMEPPNKDYRKPAVNIDGWMSEAELDWLAMQAGRAKVILEIGVWKGRSTHALCSGTAGTVFAVDAWPYPAITPAYWELHQEGKGRKAVIAECRANLADHLAGGRLFIIEMDSIGFLESAARLLFAHRKPDFVFIDGNHDPAHVRREIELCRENLLAPGGVLCGHDYPEVKDALASMRHRVAVDTIWVLE